MGLFDGLTEKTNQYYDDMVSQYKVCESGAYGEYKVNEKLKAYAKEYGGADIGGQHVPRMA